MNRLFILGAGASVDHSSGLMPCTSNFFEKVRQIEDFQFWGVRNHGLGDDEKYPKFTLTEFLIQRFYGYHPNYLLGLGGGNFSRLVEDDFRKKGFPLNEEETIKQLNSVNIEELLTLANLQNQVDIDQSFEKNVIELIISTLNYYSKRVIAKKGSYKKFVDKILKDEDSIITFNWDILLDQLFPSYFSGSNNISAILNGIYPNYLKVCTAEMEDSWKTSTLERPISDGKSKADNIFGQNYIKLHGSIDLVSCQNQGCQNHLKPFTSNPDGLNEKCGLCFENVIPYIIPPIQNKPIRDMHYIRRAWTKAKDLCQMADQVVIWGYSLPVTDHWSNWLIRHVWMGECKQIVIINPDVYSSDGKENDPFLNRFCPSEMAFGKKVERKTFKSFAEFVDSLDQQTKEDS